MRITMGSKITKAAAALLMTCYMLPAMAQTQPPGDGAPAPTPVKHKVFAECAAKNGIDISDPKKITLEQRKIIYACMKEAYKEAKIACAKETGVTLPPEGSGQQLSPEDRAKMKKCMKAKGFGRHHHRCDSDEGDGSGAGGEGNADSVNQY